MSDKLFIVTRSDLPPGARAAQSVHAAIKYAFEHQGTCREWHDGSNNLVLLEVPDEDALIRLMHTLDGADITCSWFREPDLGDEITAIAVPHAAHRLLSTLPLTLREPKKAA